jgi:two-component system nitrate/nitrite sensor histidine kinase NarX
LPIYLKDQTLSAADAPFDSLHRRLRTRLDGMRLATKLMLIGGIFLVLALASIGLTLWVTWQLEGGAAAVNEAGRMRMRSYQLALSLQQTPVGSAQRASEVAEQLQDFDRSVALLRRGDSVRPLAVPWDHRTRHHFENVVQNWQNLRDQALLIVNDGAPSDSLKNHVQAFVSQVDLFVSSIERHMSDWTTLLHTFQIAMMVLAILSALALMYAGYVVHSRTCLSTPIGLARHRSTETLPPASLSMLTTKWVHWLTASTAWPKISNRCMAIWSPR